MERYLKDEPKVSIKKERDDLNSSWEFFTAPGPLSGRWSVKVDPFCLDEFNILNDRNTDSLSMSSASSSCSGTSWDSSLSCPVKVKQERVDDEYEDNSDGYENSEKLQKCIKVENIPNSNFKANNNKLTNSIELRLISRINSSTTYHQKSSGATLNSILNSATLKTESHENLPTLTPPSSPEINITKCNTKNNISIIEPDLALLEHQGVFRVSTNQNLVKNTFVRLSANGKHSIGVTRVIQMNTNFQNLNSHKSTNNSSQDIGMMRCMIVHIHSKN
jgi:hypothetical protein